MRPAFALLEENESRSDGISMRDVGAQGLTYFLNDKSSVMSCGLRLLCRRQKKQGS